MSSLLLPIIVSRRRATPAGVVSRYWRIYITATEAAGTGSDYINCALIALHRVPGDGVNQVPIVGGTTAESSSFGGGYVSNYAWKNTAEDGSFSLGSFWHSSYQAPPYWATLDCGSGNSIEATELVLIGTNIPTRMPKDFEVQISTDGSTWTTVKSFAGITGWSATPKVFALI